jgi:NAD(P) transhydrogenase
VLRIETGSDEVRNIEADKILIATGSRPVQPVGIPFDHPNVVDSDNILDMKELPRTVVVVGAGVIGVEYAAMLSALDIGVTIVDGRTDILSFLDREIVDEFTHHLRDRGVSFRLGETVEGVDIIDDKKLVVRLASGKRIRTSMALFASGRQSNTDKLKLENAGLTPDSRGRLEVDSNFATKVPHIYAAGDVIGFPALASTSMELQWRRQSDCQ